MLRIPNEIVEEARRLAVSTGLRMYVVGTLAAYAARATEKEPEDYDLIVVGDPFEYEEYEKELTVPDKDDAYTIQFLPDSKGVELTRTRFGGLRILNADGPNVDLWHEPSVVHYLNRSDKGSSYVVDPVTAVVYKKVESPVESADVYVDGKFIYNQQFEVRRGKEWYSDAVEKRLEGVVLDKGMHRVELREPGGKKVYREWAYTREEKPSSPPAPTPETIVTKVRWWNQTLTDVKVPAFTGTGENTSAYVRAALVALADAGLTPVDAATIVFPSGPAAVHDHPIAGRSDVNKWYVADGSGRSFYSYLPKDDHPRNHQDGLTKAARRLFSLTGPAYLTASLPGTYESYGWKVYGDNPAAKPKDKQTWAVWIDGAVSYPRFQVDEGTSDEAIRDEAKRVWRGQGGLCLPGGTLNIRRCKDNGELTGPVTAFRI